MPDGIIVIDKPRDWTSMDVCAKLRGAYREKRVGHGGTLDPMATGVLPVFVGRATKAVSFAENGRKEYRAALRLGLVTDTQDITGTVLTQSAVSVTEDALRETLTRFTGEITQVPPMYSAVKIGGKKLYELARAGREVERQPRSITVYELELLGRRSAEEWELRILCSKGTYVRTLCHDVGAALGCGGVMSALRRTMASGFTLEQAVSLEEALSGGAALLRPVDSLFREYPAYRIEAEETERHCRCGNPIEAALPEGTYRVYGGNGEFLALSRCENGTLRAVKNFFGG